VQQRGDLKMIPPATVKVDLKWAGSPPSRPQPVTPRGLVRSGTPRKGGDPVAGGSWWAARAKSGEVAPGFSRDEILRPAKENPRAEGGVFGRVGSLLRELSGGVSVS
jgi:hypothetical protein